MATNETETPTQGGPTARPGEPITFERDDGTWTLLASRTTDECGGEVSHFARPDDLRAAGWIPADAGMLADLVRARTELCDERARADAAEKRCRELEDVIGDELGFPADVDGDQCPWVVSVQDAAQSLATAAEELGLVRARLDKANGRIGAAEKRADDGWKRVAALEEDIRDEERRHNETRCALVEAERKADSDASDYRQEVAAALKQPLTAGWLRLLNAISRDRTAREQAERERDEAQAKLDVHTVADKHIQEQLLGLERDIATARRTLDAVQKEIDCWDPATNSALDVVLTNLRTILATPPADDATVARDECWHCGDILEPDPAPRCDRCPRNADECPDGDDCNEPGCAPPADDAKPPPSEQSQGSADAAKALIDDYREQTRDEPNAFNLRVHYDEWSGGPHPLPPWPTRGGVVRLTEAERVVLTEAAGDPNGDYWRGAVSNILLRLDAGNEGGGS